MNHSDGFLFALARSQVSLLFSSASLANPDFDLFLGLARINPENFLQLVDRHRGFSEQAASSFIKRENNSIRHQRRFYQQAVFFKCGPLLIGLRRCFNMLSELCVEWRRNPSHKMSGVH